MHSLSLSLLQDTMVPCTTVQMLPDRLSLSLSLGFFLHTISTWGNPDASSSFSCLSFLFLSPCSLPNSHFDMTLICHKYIPSVTLLPARILAQHWLQLYFLFAEWERERCTFACSLCFLLFHLRRRREYFSCASSYFILRFPSNELSSTFRLFLSVCTPQASNFKITLPNNQYDSPVKLNPLSPFAPLFRLPKFTLTHLMKATNCV